jgi:hypothetical protein
MVSYSGEDAKAKRSIEYERDIRPILDRSCVSCHSGAAPSGNLDLSDKTNFGGYETTYLCLTAAVRDNLKCSFDKTRYIVPLQARRSLLMWKLYGRRLDGLTNETFPSEAIPGDPTSAPPGSRKEMLDLDYTGTIMPPPDSGVPPLTEEEKMLIGRWIDLGSGSDPLPAEFKDRGYFADQLPPTLNVSSPRAEAMASLDELSFAALDYLSGLDVDKTSVKADFDVNGHLAGTELFSFFQRAQDGKRFVLPLDHPITNLAAGHVTVTVYDKANNALLSGQPSDFAGPNTSTETIAFRVDPNAPQDPLPVDPVPTPNPDAPGSKPGTKPGPGGPVSGNKAPKLSARVARGSLVIQCRDDGLPAATVKNTRKGAAASRVSFNVSYVSAVGSTTLLKKWQSLVQSKARYSQSLPISRLLSRKKAQMTKGAQIVVTASDGDLLSRATVRLRGK